MAADESEKERVDRELIELLNELRVALPGVQVLFGFLLIVPFSNGWKHTTDFQRDVYVFAVLATALSTLLLIAPSAHHRLEFRAGDKQYLLKLANQLAIAGVAVLALAMSAAIFLVVDVVLQRNWATAVAAVTVAAFTVAWFGIPIWRRWRTAGPHDPGTQDG